MLVENSEANVNEDCTALDQGYFPVTLLVLTQAVVVFALGWTENILAQ